MSKAPRRQPHSAAPAPPQACFSLAVSGHRDANATFAANREAVAAELDVIFGAIAEAAAAAPRLGEAPLAAVRLHTLLADGVDQIAAADALARGWELVTPLPFGRRLNAAINARPHTLDDARKILAGRKPAAAVVKDRLAAIERLAGRARLFELADQDASIAPLFLARIEDGSDPVRTQAYGAAVSERVALAARVMIEHSDLLVAVWEGSNRAFIGGTGHTIEAALTMGAPVVWLDPRAPQDWRILSTPESLAVDGEPPPREEKIAILRKLVAAVLAPAEEGDRDPFESARALQLERWRPTSSLLWHAYRRVEAVFGGDGGALRNLRQVYESPEAVAGGAGAPVMTGLAGLPGGDPSLPAAVEAAVLRRFAWSDGVSSRLSDIYRGGMTASFLLSAAAIIAGVAYMPFVGGGDKGAFAGSEFLLLLTILAITWLGQTRRWHGRWFETRRVAEYFRHAPILLALGVARPPGRWPRGVETSWPEWYARQGLREVGLPAVAVSTDYLRAALETLLDDHVTRQRDYHARKAQRLTTVHRNLDRLSEMAFLLAVVSVAGFLLLTGAQALGLLSHQGLYSAAKWFTLAGVVLPTIGAAIAGIRYFGDFERFAAISEGTAEKLQAVHERITRLLAAPPERLSYDRVTDLAHAADEIVVSEIESWQSVFGGKHITVPV